MHAAGMVAPWLGVDDVECDQSARAYCIAREEEFREAVSACTVVEVVGFDLRSGPNSLQSWDTLGILMGGRSVRAFLPHSGSGSATVKVPTPQTVHVCD